MTRKTDFSLLGQRGFEVPDAADMIQEIGSTATATFNSIDDAARNAGEQPQLAINDTIEHIVDAARVAAGSIGAGASRNNDDNAEHHLGKHHAGILDPANGADGTGLWSSTTASNHGETAGTLAPDTSHGTQPSAGPSAFDSTSATPVSAAVATGGGTQEATSVAPNADQTLVVSSGGTVEIASPYSGTISFAGSTGTLKIDNSATLHATIGGQLAIGDVIDFGDITAGANAKISYSGNNSPGTLTVSDGTHTASIALQGNYSLANFTASSDGNGGTSVVDPPLPAGVTLQQIDGGPNYYANNGFTYAAADGWDNPNFFAIGPWDDMLVTQADANRWADLGWNTAFVLTANSSPSVARTNGISVVQDGSGPLLAGSGSETVGLLSADENYADSVNSVHTEANSIQDHRFWWLQNTWSVEAFGDIGGTPMSQILSQQLTTPNGTTRHLDTVTADTYFFTGSKDGGMLDAFGQIYGLNGPMTEDQGARGSNYGDMVDILRSYQTSNSAPIAQFIEDGEPGNAGTNADYITPSELNWASWSSIIHGAREIIYFNHTFTGSNQSDDNAAQSFYQTVQPGQTISIYDQIKATDALIEQLAPVINSPFAMNYATVNGSHYTYGTPDLTLGGLEVMAKDYNGQFYIFADTRDSETAKNIPATFTIADKNATSVTVVGENRTISVVNGVFTDVFATAATVHIYQVNDGPTGTPTAPAAPNIASFSADSGVVGDGITNDNTLTLTGAAVANSTVNVFDGTTQIGTATANGSGAWTFTTAALTDGSHSFTATDTSSGATSTASSAMTVTVDTVAPNTPVETAASIVSGTTKVQLTGTATANSTVQVFDGTTPIGTVTANGSGAWTLTTGSLNSGSHSFTSKGMDVAGNVSAASAALAVTVPSAPASAPTIGSFSADSGTAGDGITNDSTPTLTGSAAANSTVTVFDGATKLGTATANGSGVWNYTVAQLADGSHSFTATDTVSGAVSAALAVKIDTTAPTAPVEAGDSIVNQNQVTLNGTAEAGSTVKVYDGTTPVGTATVGANGSWTVTTSALSVGSHDLTATATDVAGNVSALSAPLDPVIAAPAGGGGQTSGGQNLVVNGSFESGDYTGWTLGGNYKPLSYGDQTFITTGGESGKYAAGLGSVGSDGTLSQNVQTAAGQQYTVSFWLANHGSGPDDFKVTWNGQTMLALANKSAQGYTQYTFTATGTAGTSHLEFDARQDPSYWSLDNVSVTASGSQALPGAPTIASFSTDSGIAGDHITNDKTLTLTGTAVANSTVNVFDGSNLMGTATADSSGAWSYITSVLADAIHVLKATDTVSGVTSAASAALTVTVDTMAPNAPVISSSTAAGSGAYLLKGTAEANSTVNVLESNHQIGTIKADANGAWSVTVSSLSVGSHSLTALAEDVAGNISAASAAVSVVVQGPTPAAPSIASFSTDSGIAGDHITNDNTLTLIGAAVANSTVKVLDGTTQVGMATADGNGNWTLTTTALSDGSHNLTATDTDSSGHISAPSSALAVTIDSHAPGVPNMAVYSQSGATVGSTTTLDDLMLKGTAEANSLIQISDAGKQIGTATADSKGAWSFDTGHLDDGNHNFSATAADLAGNVSASSALKQVAVDAPTGPTSSVSFTDINQNWNHSDTITGTGDANSQLNLYDGNVSIGSVKVAGDGTWSFTTPKLSSGVHTFQAEEVDSSGHVSATSSGQAIVGSNRGNTLVSTGGDDLLVGNGHSDTFVFAPNFGNDVIKDFNAQGSGHDTIQFSQSVFDSFATVLSHASQVGQDVVISAGADTLTLKNTKIGVLNSHDFHFS